MPSQLLCFRRSRLSLQVLPSWDPDVFLLSLPCTGLGFCSASHWGRLLWPPGFFNKLSSLPSIPCKAGAGEHSDLASVCRHQQVLVNDAPCMSVSSPPAFVSNSEISPILILFQSHAVYLSSLFDVWGQTQLPAWVAWPCCVFLYCLYLSRVVGCDEEYMSTALFSCVYFCLPNVRQQDEIIILNFVFSLLIFEFARPASITG